MPTYEHLCNACHHEWEDEYSIKDNPPTVCPSCQVDGQVQRLISGGSGRGIVELTGQELTSKIKSDAQTLKKEMHSSEKVYANLLGEDRYQGLQSRMDRAKRERPKIRTRK
jgi:putative FmdB family regulatory protein